MGVPELWPGYRSALNGRIHLVLGNHDHDEVFMRDSVGFVAEEFNVIVDVEGVALWLNIIPSRYPVIAQGPLRPAAPGEYDLALCGHIHEKWRQRAGCVYVGVDVWDCRPVCFRNLIRQR